VNEIKEILNQNWIATAIGVVGAVVGVIGVILAYSFKSKSRLAAQTNTLELIGRNAILPNGIEFLFRGNKVPKVTLSRVAIWNIGNTTIEGKQIVTSDPLRIVISQGSDVLEATVRSRTREVNHVSCTSRPGAANEVECRFDYLDPGDGALIQLIHTGNDIVKVLGTLRGVPKGILMGSAPKRKPQNEYQMSTFGVKVIGLGFVGLGLALTVLITVGAVAPSAPFWTVAGVCLPTICCGLLIFFAVRYMPPTLLSTQMTSNEPKKRFWKIGAK
jgi:hypothetical protein